MKNILSIMVLCIFISCFTLEYVFAQTAPASPTPKVAKDKPGKEKVVVRVDDYQFYLKSGQKSPKWDEFIEPAFQSFDSDNLPTAYVFMKRAYDVGCRDGLLLFRYGLFMEVKGRYQEAAALLSEAASAILKQYPKHPLAMDIHEHAGRVLYKIDAYDRALPELAKAAEHAPDNFMVAVMAGQLLRLNKQYGEAKALFEKALKLKSPEGITPDPKIQVIKELILLTYELKEYDACALYVEKLLVASPADPTATAYKQKLGSMKSMQNQRESIEKLVR